ncbi:BA75_04263T0 [Komagataella pastoris]|uniref:BA75_04263T0 n=1 Tax=Komagataella pastoris TaxID=4922 RepID=A0A1B2JDZ4_PICPA|nr:BA75_04263T0 [Komagataella pastoris]
MTWKNFEVKIEDFIAHVEINRPRVFNAFNKSTWREYREVLLHLDQSNDVKVIIVSGKGANFSSGLDLRDAFKEFVDIGSHKNGQTQERLLLEHVHEFQKCIGTPAEINTPIICLIHGIAYGLAIDIVSAVAIRLVTKDAKLGIKEITVGITADIGTLQRLPHIAGNSSLVNQLALTGQDFDYKVAEKLGLVSEVVDSKQDGLQACFKIAREIAQHQTWCISGTKQMVQQMLDGSDTVDEGLKNVAVYSSRNLKPEAFIKLLSNMFGKNKSKL